MVTRRQFVIGSAALVGGAALLDPRRAASEPPPPGAPVPGSAQPGGGARGAGARVVVPNGAVLPWRTVAGVKVFHLIAQPVRHQFAPGLEADCWGYNGRTPGPVIEVTQGDRVRFYVTNRLPEPTTVHWHGVLVPNGMDGVAGLTQRSIAPGQTFRYDFRFEHAGTFMYHPHFDEMTQMALGLMGMIVVHPRTGPRPDRDFAIMLSEWSVPIGTSRPDPNQMTDFNILTMNSKAYPGTEPLVARKGDRVRVRLGNLGAMHHHPIHLHGHVFRVVGTDGGAIPAAGQWPETTVLVPVGSTRDVEFVADAEGDWPLHCHMTHHIMNQMGHGIPNMVGVRAGAIDRRVRSVLPDYMTMGDSGMGGHADHAMSVPANSIAMRGTPGPFGTIDMGGMFTIVKVREGLRSYEDPGWYGHPAGTVAEPTTAEAARADGIEL